MFNVVQPGNRSSDTGISSGDVFPVLVEWYSADVHCFNVPLLLIHCLSDMSSTNKTTSVALPEPILREIGFCISCLRVTIQQWGNGDFSEPLLIKCYVGTYDTKSCTGCAKAKRSCPEVSTLFRALLRVDSDTVLRLPGLLVGHRFELLSILEGVKVV